MTRNMVNSSLIAAVAYSPEQLTLEVELNDGSIYQYYGVSPGVYELLMDAPSKGSFFNDRIKQNYKFTKI